MSYILNALRKSEQERRAGQTQTLETSILEAPQPQKKWLRWVIAGLICLNAIALINLLFSDKPDPSKNISVANSVDPQVGKQPGKIEPKPKVHSAASQPKEPDDETPPVSLTRQSPSIADMVYSRPDPAENRLSTIIPEPSAKAEKSPDFATPVESQPLEGGAIQNTRISRAKRITPKKTVPDINDNDRAPLLSDMAPEFRRRVPRLNINVFVFADDPAKRFVIIEMKKYKVHQQIAEDLHLEDILPDSLLVRYDGKIFRIKRP